MIILFELNDDSSSTVSKNVKDFAKASRYVNVER